ncbi:MAG: hypothetical protein RLZZ540_1388 [Bacteroidota bacterium]|jgi:hypothetical protein
MKVQNLSLLIITFLFTITIPVFSQSEKDTIQTDTVKKIILPVLNDNFYRKMPPAKLKYTLAKLVALPEFEKKLPSCWGKKNILGFDISEIAFVNWSAGGTSSISGLLKGDFNRTYEKKLVKWVNELSIRYGMNKQDGIEVRKTDDAFRFNSTFGHRQDPESTWFHSAKLNFNTQLTNGYKYPNKDNPISRLFAPAYMFLGVGAENTTKSKSRVLYLSPFTYKATFVWDQTLADKGAFGVEKAIYDKDGNIITKGKRSKNELGFLITNQYKKEIYKNVVFVNNLSLYSDYVNNFGNVDVDCDLGLNLVVNQYVKANIGTRILYDDDIKNKTEVAGVQVTEGPKTQLKQVLGVGITYAF